MIQETCPVKAVEQVAQNIYVLTFISRRIAESTAPGQFVNIKADEGIEPLLRRPFSVYFSTGEDVRIIFNVIGKGTAALRKKRTGDTIDVLGPLGVPFGVEGSYYETGVLVGGGLGVAPLPMVTRELERAGKRIITFLGARTASMIVDHHLHNVTVATDDGSRGFRGNVVELARQTLPVGAYPSLKIFACGPTPMLQALQKFVQEKDILCEASLEGPMGCGFGICQGCPVELIAEEKKYGLMCKDGPTFDMKRIRL
ncbi:MAG: Dihydroorotate dehydrogenase electron transfer subunit [Bacteroidetes bacterium]|nr:Dihydroorotate dehydrogenase electron transfer subunit [Bacteroidota bacterium]